MSIVQRPSEQDHLKPLRSSRHSYSILRVFCFDGFPYFIAPVFSTPAFSAPPHPGGDCDKQSVQISGNTRLLANALVCILDGFCDVNATYTDTVIEASATKYS